MYLEDLSKFSYLGVKTSLKILRFPNCMLLINRSPLLIHP
ncbi:unnamed protein product [Schistosoma mattheei]|uniref:Uncharacterized protein n=1 Tax=Schistosoma mattheei TaxID=31246 RepID=A0A183NLE8_9TREM|nr:unnamed protein product [Schistosoma mattheei]